MYRAGHQGAQMQPQGQVQPQGQEQQPAQPPQGQAQQQPAQQKGWWAVIQGYISFLLFVASRWRYVQYFIYKNISDNYSEVIAILLILLIASPM